MRALAPVLGLLAVLALAFVVYAAAGVLGRGRRPSREVSLRPSREASLRPSRRASARWRPRHYADRGHTVVAVSLTLRGGEVVEEHVVDRFADQDPDWERRFLAAREEAEQRAFHLNADAPPD